MKILHVLPSLSYDWGGPPRFVSALTESLTKKGINVSVFATTDGNEVNHKIDGVETKLFPNGLFSKYWTSYSPSLARALAQRAADFDLIHIHELWNYPDFIAYKAAKKAKIPFVVSIHGQLKAPCLNHKAFRKKIYLSLIQRRILRDASGIHAMTEEEAKIIPSFSNRNNAFLVPNGIKQESFNIIPEKKYIDSFYPELKKKVVLLFLGRITPIKGLDLLAKAFGTLLKQKNNIHLLICGPEDPDYKKIIVKLLSDNKALENTTFTGMLRGKEKLAAYSRADIFVLPSYSEGFSTSALEAMACGLPVVMTNRCKFLDLDALDAGKIIKPDVNDLVKALSELVDSPELRHQLGDKAKQLVFEKFTIDNVADEIINVYHDILNKRNNAGRE